MNLTKIIQNNYTKVQNEIEQSAVRSGRRSDQIKCIAVTKTLPVEYLLAAYECGIRDFGENYVQEAVAKITRLADVGYQDVHWHMIGHLQSNKVKILKNQFEWIHSLDRISILQEVDRHSLQSQKVLIEVNLAGESSKSGIALPSLGPMLEAAQKAAQIQVCGLMFMPPPELDVSDLHRYYEKAKAIQQEYKLKLSLPHKLEEMSMGTSYDYATAIEHGSTMVRLGTVLFGERKK